MVIGTEWTLKHLCQIAKSYGNQISFVITLTARFPQSQEFSNYPEICGYKHISTFCVCLCWPIFAQPKNFRKWHSHHLPLCAGLLTAYFTSHCYQNDTALQRTTA
jgi:hypothetical protein